MNSALAFESAYFVEALHSLFLKREYCYNSQAVDIQSCLEQIGASHQDILNQIDCNMNYAKAMRWIEGHPTAFKLEDGDATKAMLNGGFLVLLEKYGSFHILDGLLTKLAFEMDIPLTAVDVRISLSAEGAGAGLHFDRWDTAQVHLFGKKSWWLGVNSAVTAPVHSFAHNTRCAQELAAYADSDLNAKPRLHQVSLNPGDCFFVPSGMWHETQAHEYSCTIIIRIKIPAFADLIKSPDLRRKLLSQPEWRARTHGLWRGPNLNQQGLEKIGFLIATSNVSLDDVNTHWPETL